LRIAGTPLYVACVSGQDHAGFELVTVQSGARSLRSREFGETFHPVVGPMAEAVELHVRQQRLIKRAAEAREPFIIWDVGLGAAANAVAVLEAFRGRAHSPVILHSFDHTTAPLAFALQHAAELGYLTPHTDAAEALLAEGLWTAGALHWQLHAGDFRQCMSAAPPPHAILYDPYSPQSNPTLWTLEHFSAMRAHLRVGVPCLLTNYTRSTAVRVTLLLAGFFVGRGGATGEKEETTVASTELGLLDNPLDRRWIERVHRSTRSAPLRAENNAAKRISEEDWSRLAAHPQFSSGTFPSRQTAR
jgi:tRNA U34 5-methylaminomethyl-2-thiouridine-forming methyltransferase MnmC